MIEGVKRVLRGSCWYGNAQNCRSAFRSNYDPGNRSRNVGFRLAGIKGSPRLILIRGGSWVNGSNYLYCTFISGRDDPRNRDIITGFRVIRDNNNMITNNKIKQEY